MRVRIVQTIYWGGPQDLRRFFDPWPFDAVPRVGDHLSFEGPDGSEHTGAVERVWWSVDASPPEVEVHLKAPQTPRDNGWSSSERAAAWATEEIALWEAVGFSR